MTRSTTTPTWPEITALAEVFRTQIGGCYGYVAAALEHDHRALKHEFERNTMASISGPIANTHMPVTQPKDAPTKQCCARCRRGVKGFGELPCGYDLKYPNPRCEHSAAKFREEQEQKRIEEWRREWEDRNPDDDTKEVSRG